MAVLLVGISIAAVMLTVAMPVWKQMAQREKEEELVFRGQQYVRALRLFSRKYANASPPNLNVLVEQRFIRKKFKDPITNDDFQPILAGQSVAGTSTGAAGASGGTGGRGASSSGLTASAAAGPTGGPSPQGVPGFQSQPTTGRGTSPIGTPGAGPTGGVIGVVSKSKDKSIRLFNGRSHYNEWAFINTPQVLAPAAPGAPGVGGPGQRGRPVQPGQNPFGGPPSLGPPGSIGGQRGRGTLPNNPGGRPGGPGQPLPTGPQRGPGGTFAPFQPGQPIQPIQPVPPGRGRGQ